MARPKKTAPVTTGPRVHKHPHYSSIERDVAWRALTVKGGREYRAGTDSEGRRVLPRFSTEKATQYEDRVASTPVINLAAEFVRQRAGAVFGAPISRPAIDGKAPDKVFAEWSKDVDLTGAGLSRWMSSRLRDALTWGYVYLGVDSPPKGDANEPKSPADVMVNKASRPWATWADPRDVWDWEWDEHGAELVRIVIHRERMVKSSAMSEAVTQEWCIEWTPETWQRFDLDDGKWSAEDPVPHGFGKVPWFKAEPLEDEAYVDRFAELQKAIIQTVSDMVAEQRANVYTQKVITGVSPSQVARTEVGPSDALVLSEPGARIDTISGNPAVMESLRENMKLYILEAYRRSEMADKNAEISLTQPQSGISKAYDFHELEQLLKDIASSWQSSENKLIRLWALAIGSKVGEQLATSQYSTEFDVLSDSALFEVDKWTLESNATDEHKRAVWRDRAARRFRAKTPERDEIIESYSPEKWSSTPGRALNKPRPFGKPDAPDARAPIPPMRGARTMPPAVGQRVTR